MSSQIPAHSRLGDPDFEERAQAFAEAEDLPCRANPDAWFSDDPEDRMFAMRVCSWCEHKVACLERALVLEEQDRAAHNERRPRRHGIWGETTPMQRSRIAAARKRVQPKKKEKVNA